LSKSGPFGFRGLARTALVAVALIVASAAR
jgi:hypothetical protein